jgi:tRNA pseudouridine38-40 synthase
LTRFALTVEFDGRPFMGWQRQDHGPSVQQAIEDAAFAVTGEKASVHAAGRTDAGVHGLGMRAHVDMAKPITAFRLMEALNARRAAQSGGDPRLRRGGGRLACALLVCCAPL